MGSLRFMLRVVIFLLLVFITERQTFMSFCDYIPKKDFVSLPDNCWEAVYRSVSFS